MATITGAPCKSIALQEQPNSLIVGSSGDVEKFVNEFVRAKILSSCADCAAGINFDLRHLIIQKLILILLGFLMEASCGGMKIDDEEFRRRVFSIQDSQRNS